MNIHHLELFYHVARHGGVSAAVQRMPYGIQQPAVSAQIIQLENSLGTTLFIRRPFKLTNAGKELYQYIDPFFSSLDEVARRLRGGGEVSIRIGAMETVHREYLPRILKTMRRRFPRLDFTLVPADFDLIEASLLAQEIDLGISHLLGKRAEGIHQREMLRVSMALMVPKQSPLRSASELWNQDRISERLISGGPDSVICRMFQGELRKRGVEWFSSLEFSSPELIARYVVEGFGIGLVLVEPGVAEPEGARILPLEDFPSIPYGILWMGILSPIQRAFLDEAQALAESLSSGISLKPKTRSQTRRGKETAQSGAWRKAANREA